MWQRCLVALEQAPEEVPHPLSTWPFCGNECEADALAALVMAGQKRAIAPTTAAYEGHRARIL